MKHSLKTILAAAAGSIILSTGAQATVFSFDEFFINKNGGEIFRDSFTDGSAPPTGPDDGVLGPGGTYSVTGAGFSEPGTGKLLADSALGVLTSNPNGDARLFNRIRRNRSTSPTSSAVLDAASDWTVSSLLDLTILPANPGEAFGVRIEDFSGSNPYGGNDRMLLEVRRTNSTGTLGVLFQGLDFNGVGLETFDCFALDPLLTSNPGADQILLSITHAAGTNEIDAQFSLFSGGLEIVGTQTSLDNVANSDGLSVASVFSDENFTRAALYTIENAEVEVSEPGALLVLSGGLLAFAGMRRRRR